MKNFHFFMASSTVAIFILFTACNPDDENNGNGNGNGNGNEENLPVFYCGPYSDYPEPGENAPSISGLVDLGSDCLIPTHIAIRNEKAYVTCSGNFGADEGRLVIVNIDDLSVAASVFLGGMPGKLLISNNKVIITDMIDGRLFITDLSGEILHDYSNPVVLCPSDFENNLFQFISGLASTGDDYLASCFASDEILKFSFAPGEENDRVSNAVIRARIIGGHGASDIAIWDNERAAVIDSLAGTASLLHTDGDMQIDKGRWQLGETPNEILIDNDHATVINSASQTIQILDLNADPESATVQEIFTGDGTNPMHLVKISESRAIVTLMQADQIAEVDLQKGRITACVDLPSGEDLLPFEDKNPLARPQSIAIADEKRALIVLNNADLNWMPAGNGMLIAVDFQ